MMTLMATALVAPVAGAQAAPRIVATTGLIADAARRLTGFDIRAIAAPPHDPALHRPGRSDLVAIADADLVLRHGPGLERRMDDLLQRQAARGRVIALEDLLPDPPAQGAQIAHDPALWSAAVQALAARLAQELPASADSILRAGHGFAGDVLAHAPAIAKTLAPIPAHQRLIVTEAPGMAHFARAFGFDAIALSDATDARSLAALADRLATAGVSAIFTTADAPSTARLLQITAARGHALHPAGALLSDADWPAPAGDSGWHRMMTRNATRIAAALAPGAALA